jgi:hypothetical protein
MDQAATASKLDGSEAAVKMSIYDKGGSSRVRELTMASKLYGSTEKRIFRFQSPADVKGTGILVYDHQSKADDVWVFLPALRKSRRIVSSQQSQSFMGSEFSYGDMTFPDLNNYKYKYLGEESAAGEGCWKVEVTPKDKGVASNDGYSKKIYWVSKSSNMVRKGLFYGTDGKELKQYSTQNIKLVDSKKKRYRALKMEMVNKKNGRKSVFETKDVKLVPSTKDEYFTMRYLERT